MIAPGSAVQQEAVEKESVPTDSPDAAPEIEGPQTLAPTMAPTYMEEVSIFFVLLKLSGCIGGFCVVKECLFADCMLPVTASLTMQCLP